MNIFFSGKAGELDCSRGDGVLFADGELFCEMPFYMERGSSSPSLCTRSVCQARMSVRRGRAYLPAIPSEQGNKEKKNKHVVKLTSVVAG